MGYIKHNAVVVTGWNEEHMNQAREKAVELFEKFTEEEGVVPPYGSKLISPIIGGLVNSQLSFFIAPDGSKEGWTTSDNCNYAREAFLDWLRDSYIFCEYIEVRFGGDDEYESIVRSNEIDSRD